MYRPRISKTLVLVRSRVKKYKPRLKPSIIQTLDLSLQTYTKPRSLPNLGFSLFCDSASAYGDGYLNQTL